ncbi:MAG TPA: glycerol-3-phosphate acyltransferase [Ignavibacteriaceae bacterium]|nr:glycerol-3-phosphate acyltransferase [Ignavibacteriaceae bacterium]
MEYLLSLLIGYLLGSFPTAYLLLKKVSKLDIRTQGSGNVGAMNTFEVSKSKTMGVLVLLIDALKGLLSVYISLLVFPLNFIFPAIALLFAVLSHCFNPWLKLKGGRGLATSAGGAALLFPPMLIIWLATWFISYIIKKNIIFSNVFASLSTIIILYITIETVINYSFPKAESIASLLLFSTGLMIIIFVKHVDPFMELFNKKTIK